MKKFDKIKFIKLSAIVPMALALTACGGSSSKNVEIDLNDYVSVSYEGYDSLGTVQDFEIDFEKLVNDNLGAFDLEGEDTTAGDISVVAYEIENIFYGDIDKRSDLSNGDTIKLSWSVDEAALTSFNEIYGNVNFIYSDSSITVSNLDEPEEFNPFDYLTVTYDGIAPNGNANLKTSSLPVSGLYFRADKSSDLSNGDKIKVTVVCDYDDMDAYCLRYGMKASETEKDFTVEGLSSYASELSEIPQDVLDKIDSQTQDTLAAYVAGNWVDPTSFHGMELIGNYFLTPKDPSLYTGYHNYLYFVYKVTAKDLSLEEGQEGDFDYYYYSYITNLMILDDGTCSFDLSYLQTPNDSFRVGRYYYYGYEDLDSLFSKQVTSKIDKYSYENTVEDSVKTTEPPTEASTEAPTEAEKDEEVTTTAESTKADEDTTEAEEVTTTAESTKADEDSTKAEEEDTTTETEDSEESEDVTTTKKD